MIKRTATALLALCLFLIVGELGAQENSAMSESQVVLTFPASSQHTAVRGGCLGTETTLCLLRGRIRADLVYVNQHDGGTSGRGRAMTITDRSGAFSIFERENLEVVIKVLDGSALNGALWVGVASLTDIEFTLTVTDALTGLSKSYENAPGNLYGLLDTRALPEDLLGPGDTCGGFVAPGTPFRCQPGLVCIEEPGICAIIADGQGTCVERPDACIEIYDPVCGCDGQTYANDCFLLQTGVSKLSDGECADTRRSCVPGVLTDCGDEQFCDTPIGLCSAPTGVCTDVPLGGCPEFLDPICGCDGRTYDNSCFLQQAGVAQLHPGPCQSDVGKMCGGIAGFPCSGGLTCQLDDGMCSVADVAGTCQEVPTVCTADFLPVCGCDGKTYSNDCNLRIAGIAKNHDGACR